MTYVINSAHHGGEAARKCNIDIVVLHFEVMHGVAAIWI